MSSLLDGLNPAQRKAVTTTEGPVLVLAGPGSGKTRVLTHRVAYLIQDCGVPPWRIMAVTFTNKAAREMKARLHRLLGSAGLQGLTIGTFHAICARILRREAEVIGLDRNYVIYDTDDQRRLVRRALRELNLDDKVYTPRSMLSIISRAKVNLLTPQSFVPATYREEIARRVYEQYQKLLADNNALDFDDLLMRVVLAFRECQELRQKYRGRYHYILVDEFQDTNKVQYELVRHMAGETRNLFVVGDEDQSIYAFRGADFRNVLRFERDYPDAVKILLEENYRSTQTILDAANAVIAPNVMRTPKRLFTSRGRGAGIVIHEAYDENEEGQWVVESIRSLIEKGTSPGSCAVMYRVNAQSRALEEAFIAQGMPYKLVGATRFYDRREVKDLLAYLHIIYNPNDTVSLLRVINTPPRKIGAKTLGAFTRWASRKGLSPYDALARLEDAADAALPTVGRRALLRFYEMWRSWVEARERMDVLQLLDRVIADTNYAKYLRVGEKEGDERWDNVLELRAVASEYSVLPPEDSLITFLEEISLVSDVDNLEDEQAPALLTLHSAKGLEFDAVFIVGVNDGLLPHSRSFGDHEAMEEERRLFYVGVTRARERLYLSYTFRRTLYGSNDLCEPSPFLSDIPDRLKVMSRAHSSTPTPHSPRRPRRQGQAPLKPGDKVRHPSFGEGTVIGAERRGNDWDITVSFRRRGIKTLALSFANLKKV